MVCFGIHCEVTFQVVLTFHSSRSLGSREVPLLDSSTKSSTTRKSLLNLEPPQKKQIHPKTDLLLIF